MLVVDPCRLELRLVLHLVDLLEDVLESPVVLFHDGVFGRQEQWHLLSKSHLEGGVSEAGDRLQREWELSKCDGNDNWLT